MSTVKNGADPVMAYIDLLKTEAGKIVIRHTEVDPALEGQGIGKALLNHVFDYSRKIEFKILPICPFSKNVMYKNLDKSTGTYSNLSYILTFSVIVRP